MGVSRIPVGDMEKDDEEIIDGLWGSEGSTAETNREANVKGNGMSKVKPKATGHIILDNEAKDRVKEEDRCARWKALKRYIYE